MAAAVPAPDLPSLVVADAELATALAAVVRGHGGAVRVAADKVAPAAASLVHISCLAVQMKS